MRRSWTNYSDCASDQWTHFWCVVFAYAVSSSNDIFSIIGGVSDVAWKSEFNTLAAGDDLHVFKSVGDKPYVVLGN